MCIVHQGSLACQEYFTCNTWLTVKRKRDWEIEE